MPGNIQFVNDELMQKIQSLRRVEPTNEQVNLEIFLI